MSGQWIPATTHIPCGQGNITAKPIEGVSCFPRILTRPISLEHALLRQKVDQLLPDETKVVSAYVDNVLNTRPIKEASLREAENRAHMAVLELENDPR